MSIEQRSTAGGAGRPDGVARVVESAALGDLVAVIGTGLSMALTNGARPALSWKGLVVDGFAYGVTKGKITAAQSDGWKAQLQSNDLDDLLSAAEFMGRKLGAPGGDLYARWLEHVFKDVEPANAKMEDAVRTLRAAGVPLATLNYDSLVETVTSLPGITLRDTAKVAAWIRRDNESVLHLHGSWDAPETCILGIRDYETTLRDDVRALFQRDLGAFRRLLFIGCGDTFADPNFSSLVEWLRQKMGTAALEHYALVTDAELSARHADPSWQGFVEPIGYGARDDLPAFLAGLFGPLAQPAAKGGRPVRSASPSRFGALLESYRAFIVRDCGLMTIEGLTVDPGTPQSRFDLERLFVPMALLPLPAETPDDPHREAKLPEAAAGTKPRPVSDVITEHPRVALLALPGGGKSLLLKRIAVAYADPARRQRSDDGLPELDVTPVYIRCREWREHLQRPIPTLLTHIADVTGEASLTGLGDALAPLFIKGRVLLLVDGLDEIHDDATRLTFVENLETFLARHPQTRLMVTSREAGFNRVAPAIARFCERWRIAPLQPGGIAALCDRWHRLMSGDSPGVVKEAREVAEQLVKNESLLRLAENPLLLTMLLVVKRGAGRIPLDRVDLYGRAVEVLLDTWNIKGHEPLNPKEAVPQLASVALEMMRAGKQTAAEQELLGWIEEAREKVPKIRRYARGTPYEFLERVERRSSLLVEAGQQIESGRPVPFYQFRHLTFQEYLAAVAVADGHYVGYQSTDTVLTPLAPHLASEEWKEVVSMSAVLAGNQADPLMAALVREGVELRSKVEHGVAFAGKEEWATGGRLPAPVARLVHCLAEEAEAAPDTLVTALQLAAFFARGCQSRDDWKGLARGPYGEELVHQAFDLYLPMTWPEATRLLETCAALTAFWRSDFDPPGEAYLEEWDRLLASSSRDEIARGLLLGMAMTWNRSPFRFFGIGSRLTHVESRMGVIEHHIFNDDPAIWGPAAWTWAYLRMLRQNPAAFATWPALPLPGTSLRPTTVQMLDRLLSLWMSDRHTETIVRALYTARGLARDRWTPALTAAQVEKVRDLAGHELEALTEFVALLIAFHARSVWSDEELSERLRKARESSLARILFGANVDAMLAQIRKDA